MQYVAEIKGIEKEIEQFTLGPVSFAIEPGTITALVGDNGSGKSTLMKIMMDLVGADAGHVEIVGLHTTGENEDWKRAVAYQAQSQLGYESLTAIDLVELISHWYPNWDQAFFDSIVEKLHIPLDKKYSKLSQGVQQKLNFALAIARNPTLLILDEPTASLDIPSKQIIIHIITEWMEYDERAVLLASHHAEDIKKLADYITVLRAGKMIGHFEKEALIEQYRSYWLMNPIPNNKIPGEVSRSDQALISNDSHITESYLEENDIAYTNSAVVSLEDIITILLTTETVE